MTDMHKKYVDSLGFILFKLLSLIFLVAVSVYSASRIGETIIDGNKRKLTAVVDSAANTAWGRMPGTGVHMDPASTWIM